MISPPSTVADSVGATIAAHGVHDVFGILGSGNLVVTNAMRNSGARFHHARHETSAVAMADGYARASGRVGVASVHQGPGLTNAMTALAEAAKSRTPVLVLAGDTPAAAITSNFRIDQHGLVESVGAIAERIHQPQTAARDAARAYRRAERERRPVVLMLPIDVQAQAMADGSAAPPNGQTGIDRAVPFPDPAAITHAASLLARAQRPAIIAGRGAVNADAGPALEVLAERVGAVLLTSAPAHGLFAGNPYALGISGGFATPQTQELLPTADTILVVGASANHWTTRHGALIAPGATVIHIDIEQAAFGRNLTPDATILGDARAAATLLEQELAGQNHHATGFRTGDFTKKPWKTEPYAAADTDEFIDPRTLSIALNELLPPNRAVAVDSGAFTGWPAMYLDVPDARAWAFANGFQSVGLGLGTAIGLALAEPNRPTVAALGDGGAFMALAELETAVRLKLMLLVLIYDDAAYGAEVHHFGPMGYDTGPVTFPDVDLAAIARAAGAKAATVRNPDDLRVVEEWLLNPHGPLVLDAKVNPTICADWLAEAFRGG